MYNYTICDETNVFIFQKQCAVIEKHISPFEKDALLTDVDGTMIQKYRHDDVQIKVVNDVVTDTVYVESNKDIKNFFI